MNRSVTFIQQGREGQAIYSEGPHSIAGYQEFGGGDVVAMRSIVGRHKRTDVTHQKQFAGTGPRQQIRHQARIRAANEQGGRMLPLVYQGLELLTVLWKRVVVETAQAI